MSYYILQNNIKKGPFSITELKEQDINHDTLVWSVGFTNWMKAKDVPELADLLSEIPPSIEVPSIPKTWLVESILVTCLCCLPLGIVGIIYASKVEGCYYNKEYDQALYYSNQAKKWCIWGVVLMGLAVFAYIAFLLIIFLLGAIH